MSKCNGLIVNDSREPIHTWFGLTYAQYLTIPRSILQSMPVDWQQEFVDLLNELDDTIDWRPDWGTQYKVSLYTIEEDINGQREWGIELPDPYMDYERGRKRVPRKIVKGDFIIIKDNLREVMTNLEFDEDTIDAFVDRYIGKKMKVYYIWEDEDGQKYATVDLCVEIPIECCQLAA